MEYESLFKAARQAGTLLAETETERLGRTLMHAAQLLRTHTPRLLEANARDLEAMAPDSPPPMPSTVQSSPGSSKPLRGTPAKSCPMRAISSNSVMGQR